MPFLPGASSAKLRLELTLGAVVPNRLALLTNGTVLTSAGTSPVVAAAEQRYFAERAQAEVGWNTWLTKDMLTHALLPSGLAVSVALHVGNVRPSFWHPCCQSIGPAFTCAIGPHVVKAAHATHGQ